MDRSFLKNSFVSVNSYYNLSFLLQKPFAKTVLVEIDMWYLETHRGLWWKWKYLPLKIWKKISEKLLSFVVNWSESYRFPLKKSFPKTILVEFAKWYLEAHRGLWQKRKYLKIKTERKLYEKLRCVLLIHLTELQLSPKQAVHWDCSCGICKVILEAHRGLSWKR